jgi:hypothetical protein
MDPSHTSRTHRLQEAANGFPLLRGCPSSLVLRRLAQLDALTGPERLAYADQLSDLSDARATEPLAEAARQDLLAHLPLVARLEEAAPSPPDLRFQNVKNLARLAAEPDGIAGFVRLHNLPPEAAQPPAPHVPTFEAAVPAPPARLRKVVLAAVQKRFGGQAQKVSSDHEHLVAPLPQGKLVLDLGFSSKGWGAMARQMHYSLWADLDGVRLLPTSYEALWLLPAQWDLITVGNLDSTAAHLVRVIETRLAIATG